MGENFVLCFDKKIKHTCFNVDISTTHLAQAAPDFETGSLIQNLSYLTFKFFTDINLKNNSELKINSSIN